MEGMVLLEIDDKVFLCNRPFRNNDSGRLRHRLYTYYGKKKLYDIRLDDFSLKMQLRNKDFEIPVFKDYDFTIKNYDSKYSISSLEWVGKKALVWLLYFDLEKRIIVNGRITKTKSDFENINISVSDDRKYDLQTKADDWYFFGDNNIRKISDSYLHGHDRWGHQVTEFNGKLYLTGGAYKEDDRVKYLNDVWVSDDGRIWTNLTSDASFSARSHHQCVVYKGRLWILGGYNGDKALGDVYTSHDGNSWELYENSLPVSLFNHQCLVFKNALYSIGGADSNRNYTNYVFYTFGTGIWGTLQTYNLPKISRHQAVVWQNRIYVIGGSNGIQYSTPLVHFSENGSRWAQDPRALRIGRVSHQVVVSDDKMWLIGGNHEHDLYLSDVSSISPDDIGWTPARAGGVMPARGNHQAVVFKNKIFVYGGEYVVDNVFTVRTDAWAMCDGGDDFEGLEQYINARFLGQLRSKILNESYLERDVKIDIFGEKNSFDVLKKIIERLFLYMIQDNKSENYWLRPINYKSEKIRTLTPNVSFSIERTSDSFYSNFAFKDYSGRTPYELDAKEAIRIYFGVDLFKKYEIQTFFKNVRSRVPTSPIVELYKRYSQSRFVVSFETTDDIRDLLLYDTVKIFALIREFSYGKIFQGRIFKIDYSKSALEVECLLLDSVNLH